MSVIAKPLMKSVNRLLISMSNKFFDEIFNFMCGSSHSRNVVIGVEYRTLDVYLLFAICMGQIQSELIYIFVTYGLASL